MNARDCEVCGTPVVAWSLAADTVLWRCPQCRHVARSMDDCRAHARAEAWGGERAFDRVRLSLTYRGLRRHVPSRGAVFEVGFGEGQLLSRFRSAGHPVGGVDRGMWDRRITPDLCDLPAVREGTVEDLPPAEDYDLVYGVHVVEHAEDLHAFLAACHGLLRPGGILLLLTPTTDSRGPQLFGSGWWPLEDPTHVRFLSEESARRSLLAAGFRDVGVRRSLTDNMSMEFCSLVRRLAPRDRHNGVLGQRWVVVSAAITSPLAILARLVDPRLRPTMIITGARPLERAAEP